MSDPSVANVVSGTSDTTLSTSGTYPSHGPSDDLKPNKLDNNLALQQLAPFGEYKPAQSTYDIAQKSHGSGSNDGHENSLSNADIQTQSLLSFFLGSPAAPGFMHETTPSTAEPLWQRRINARLQASHQPSQQSLLSSSSYIVQGGNGEMQQQPGLPSISPSVDGVQADQIALAVDASYSDMLAGIWQGMTDNSHSAIGRSTQPGIENTSSSQQTSMLESFDMMSPMQMHWSANSGAIGYDAKNIEHGGEMQRHASRSQSSNETEYSTASDSTMNMKRDPSSLPTSVDASPVDFSISFQAPTTAQNRPIIRRKHQSESSQGEEGTDESVASSSHGDNTRLHTHQRQNRRRGQSSPKMVATVPLTNAGPVKTSQSRGDYLAPLLSDQYKNEQRAYPAFSTCADSKGVINKVIISSQSGQSKEFNTDNNVLETAELEEGDEVRHLCPHPGCDKHFSTSGHARRHSRIHASLRPFECPHDGCGATFTRRDNCTQHQRARHRSQLTARRISDDL